MANNIATEDPIIKSITVVNNVDNNVLIKIKLKVPVNYQNNSLVPVNLAGVHYQYRYVLDLYPRQDADNDELNDDILALIQLNGINDDNNKVSKANKKTNLSIIDKKVTIISKTNTIIMIDPGHGGEDPGAIGPTGLKEKDVVLDISHKLKALIDRSSNFNCYMTRNQDLFIPLQTRVQMARKIKADIFISIHADAFTNNTASGASVFVLSEKGSSSAFAKWLAKNQNDSDLIGGVSFKNKDKLVNNVLMDMTHTYVQQNSAKFGMILLKNMSLLGKLHNNKVEKANFAVLKAPDITSVLLETAFISNYKEENSLRNNDYRDKIAHTIFLSFKDMLD